MHKVTRPWPIIQGAGSRALEMDQKAWINALDQERLFGMCRRPAKKKNLFLIRAR